MPCLRCTVSGVHGAPVRLVGLIAVGILVTAWLHRQREGALERPDPQAISIILYMGMYLCMFGSAISCVAHSPTSSVRSASRAFR